MQRKAIEELLCCPVDGHYPFQIKEAGWAGEELVSGTLYCSTCGHGYPVEDGIPLLLYPTDSEQSDVAAAKQRESAARDADAAGYDSTISNYQTTIELKAVMNALSVRPTDVVLDLGAGTGRLTTLLAAAGATVVAIDISPASLKINRDRCAGLQGSNVHYIACDVCHLPLRDGIANKAGSSMMLEHIPTEEERKRCLSQIYRVLRPGSKLALTAYNYSWSKRRRAEREGFHGGGLYYYRFDRTELGNLLGGFQTHKVSGVLSLPEGVRSPALDRLIFAVPPVAGLAADLLFATAER